MVSVILRAIVRREDWSTINFGRNNNKKDTEYSLQQILQIILSDRK